MKRLFLMEKLWIISFIPSSVHSKIRNVLHFLEMHFLPLGEVHSYWKNFEPCKVWFCIIHNAYQICMMARGGGDFWGWGWELRKGKLPLKDITYSSGHLHPNSHACRYAVAYISYIISWGMGISYSTKYARILHTYILFKSCLQLNRSWIKPVKVTISAKLM